MKTSALRKSVRVLTFTVPFVTALVVGCQMPGRGVQQKEERTSVTITSPQPMEIVRSVRFAGNLAGRREVMVYPPLPGKFTGYISSDGAYVPKGGTIARIDRDIPGVEFEPVPVEAPISGRFFSMGISPGEAVVPQIPVARISETGTLKLEFNVPEKYINSVRQGSRAQLYVPSLDYRTSAMISRVSRFIDSRSGAAQAEATVSNPAGKMTPGMYAEINVAVASKKASLALPIDCVLGLDGRFVYVVSGRKTVPDTTFITRKVKRGKPAVDTTITMINVGVAVKRNVEVGLDNGAFIEIVSGLEPGDEVLYVGQRIVEEEGKVQITGTYDFSKGAADD